MRVNSIVFEKKITKEEKASLGTYSNETLRLEATLGENENRDVSILNLMEIVHAHLDVPFKSPIKDKLAAVMAQTQETREVVLTEKDTVPSDPKLKRPAKVDKAAKKLKELEGRKDEPKSEVKSDAREEQAEPAKETGAAEAKATNDEGSVQSEQAVKEEVEVKKEEVKKPKAKGIPYNREDIAHKKEFARVIDNLYAGWRKDASGKMKQHVIMISKAMEGKTLFTASGNISTSFSKEIKKMVDAL